MKKTKLNAIALALVVSLQPCLVIADDVVTAAPPTVEASPVPVTPPGKAPSTEVKTGADWRYLAVVPGLWPIGVVLMISGWKPAPVDGAVETAKPAPEENPWSVE